MQYEQPDVTTASQVDGNEPRPTEQPPHTSFVSIVVLQDFFHLASASLNLLQC